MSSQSPSILKQTFYGSLIGTGVNLAFTNPQKAFVLGATSAVANIAYEGIACYLFSKDNSLCGRCIHELSNLEVDINDSIDPVFNVVARITCFALITLGNMYLMSQASSQISTLLSLVQLNASYYDYITPLALTSIYITGSFIFDSFENGLLNLSFENLFPDSNPTVQKMAIQAITSTIRSYYLISSITKVDRTIACLSTIIGAIFSKSIS